MEQRKNVIIALLCGHGHIGEPEIREIIGNYTKNAVAVDFEKGRISILIDGMVFDEVNLYHTLLKRIATTQLEIFFNILKPKGNI